MARDVALDPKTRDIAWPPHYISGKAELQQSLLTLLLTPKGHIPGYPNIGMNYAPVVNGYNPSELRLAIHDAIMEDNRVIHINQIKIKPNKEHTKVKILISVQTTLGKIQFSREMNRRAAK